MIDTCAENFREKPSIAPMPPAQACLKIKASTLLFFRSTESVQLQRGKIGYDALLKYSVCSRRAARSSSRHITQSCFSICRAWTMRGWLEKLGDWHVLLSQAYPLQCAYSAPVLSAQLPRSSSWGHTQLLLNAGTDRARRRLSGISVPRGCTNLHSRKVPRDVSGPPSSSSQRSATFLFPLRSTPSRNQSKDLFTTREACKRQDMRVL